MARIKIGIIGTGAMARAHAQRFGAMRGVDLTACYDVLPAAAQRFVDELGFKRAADSVDDLLDAVDAVCIVTPDAYHAELCLKAFKAGRHVFCEKPLTTTLADARKVARAAKRASERDGLIHLINFTYRNSAAFQRAVQLVQQGKLGEIRHVDGKYYQGWLTGQRWDASKEGVDPPWRLCIPKGGNVASGGVLGDLGCHILDFASTIAGEIESLQCSSANFPKVDTATGNAVTKWNGKKMDANDSVMVQLGLAGGGAGTIQSTRWAGGRNNQVALEVYGTHGSLKIDLEVGWNQLHTFLRTGRGKPAWKTLELKPTPTNNQRFIRAIKRGEPDQPDLVRGAHVQAYLDACERSAQADGKRVTIAKWQ